MKEFTNCRAPSPAVLKMSFHDYENKKNMASTQTGLDQALHKCINQESYNLLYTGQE